MVTAPRNRRSNKKKPLLQSLLVGCLLFVLCLWAYSTYTFAVSHPQRAAEALHHAVVHSTTDGTSPGPAPLLRHIVWWFAPFLSGGGYSSEANSFVLGLIRSGFVPPGRLWLTQHGDAVDEDVLHGMPIADKRDLAHMMDAADYTHARDAIIICHSEPGAWALPEPLFMTSFCPPDPRRALYTIGRTMFETDRLAANHVERCNMMSEIWVPTEFHKQVFIHSGVAPGKLHVLGEAVDVDHFDPAKTMPSGLKFAVRVFGPQRDKEVAKYFRFLSVFKWEERKGWDVLLSAYLREFTANDSVLLYLKTNPYHSNTDFGSQMHAWARSHLNMSSAAMAHLPRVYVIGRHIPQKSLPSLYKAVDAFVLPSRGEGWGRPHVEAMAMELPVIATNWSGPTAYLTEQNGYPLRIEGLVPLPADSPFAGHKWAQPSVAHLQKLMRHVSKHPLEAADKGRRARHTMVANFTSQRLAAQVASRLAAISQSLPASRGGTRAGRVI